MPEGLGPAFEVRMGLFGDAALIAGTEGDIDLWFGGTRLGKFPRSMLQDQETLFKEANARIKTAIAEQFKLLFE